MFNSPADLSTSKKHYAILDGLRGVAALVIVIFHFLEWIYSDFSDNIVGHGYLAVDFFFCLSGFVIGYAYDDRINQMGLKQFFISRAIRLHPLVILGGILGLLGYFFDPFTGPEEVLSTSRMILIIVFTLVLIPFPVMKDKVYNMFGLNAPAWSLFWEYIANIVYALFLSRIRRTFLILLTLVAAGVLCYVSYTAGGLSGGWGKGNFWEGGARIGYSFLAGLLIHRSKWILHSKLGFASLSILLILPFMMPFTSWNWLAESLVVLFYFPLLVSLGAGAVLSPSLRKICNFSGQISYPIYMTHYWGIWVFAHYYMQYKPSTEQLFYIIPVCVILLVLFAYLTMIIYDIPIRRYLSRKMRK
ncbi:acyltransferase family protein [Sphingobacterium spiritivorum]|uniref:Acyltransferase n=1 Tax=Sphingobacterium spiritivorum ATCC 33861 TaxID=525373 RepID=D7VS71_SPHSI|nr:acyltransferase [Sphingobacterium spiritivorum]EFK56622.1 acyltransferase [Sphingobacterium spiritivorum ATCC 33861]QQT35331.1 acyltransferase [Sphingobacterium spiritivorum]WQD32012.1 acyltransferase [Sphingobacterium spiritivorum]SUJ04961.1 Uncharacterized protein conserved in bacteria [Sphingobacterium spiritivorum]